MPRACLICGSTPATEEHVWAKWLKKITRHETGKYQMGITTDPDGWREWTGASFEHTARVLCERCNHRLGELDGRVRPVVEGLILGTATSVNSTEQAELAQWLYKTGLMVSTTLRHEASALPPWHYSGLEETLDLPPASAVWIGLIDRRVQEAALWVQRFQWRDRYVSDPPPAEGYIFVLGVGELAAIVGVLDVRQSPASTDMNPFILGSLGVGRLLRIWPASQHYGFRWPPPQTIRAEDLRGIADAFVKTLQPRSADDAPRPGN